jgi:hypothetical protein
MGYDVYITRAEHPDESGQHPISEADWNALVESDASLKLSPTDYYERRTPDGKTEKLPMVIWTAHPSRPPFLLMDGAIYIKSPNEATVEKMVEMAGKLKARVVDEDGEVYSSGTPTGGPVSSAPPPPGFRAWPLWKRLLAAFLFGCVLLALKLLIFGK